MYVNTAPATMCGVKTVPWFRHSLTSHCRAPLSVPWQFMWVLWWTEW